MPRWLLQLKAFSDAQGANLDIGSALQSALSSAQENLAWKASRLGAVADVLGGFRLPGDVTPDHYDLTIEPHLEAGDMHFTGSVDIAVLPPADTNRVTLHAHKDLTVTVTAVKDAGDASKVIAVTGTSYLRRTEQLRIYLDTPLRTATKYIISLTFSGPLAKDNRGLYLSSYTAQGQVK